MNIYDVIIWFIVFAILFSVMVLWLWNNYSDISNLKISNQIISFQDNITNLLHYNNSINKSSLGHVNFLSENKANFLNTFWWTNLNISSTSRDNSDFDCYNYFLDQDQIILHTKINNKDVDIKDESFILTDYNWDLWVNNLLNIVCFYNTFDYLWFDIYSDISKSPLSYVLYSFYEDISFNQQYYTRKWILYFN